MNTLEIMKQIQDACQKLLDIIDGNACTWFDICQLAEPNQPNSANNTEMALSAISKLKISNVISDLKEIK